MNNFKFVTGSIELLDFVQPLWEKLNKLMRLIQTIFKVDS